MNDPLFNSLFRKLLNRTATKEDKAELRKLWDKETSHPDQLFPYKDWQDTTSEEPLPEALRQRTIQYILSKEGTIIPQRNRFLRWLPAAAAMLIFAVAGLWMLRNIPSKEIPMQVVTTALGERKILTLTDGSTVHLNGGSSVYFPEHFSKEQRLISLKGEAFFEIRQDHTRPFVVQAGQISTTVLGTSFNIAAWADEASVTVSVKTGKVKVATAGGDAEELKQGMQAVYNEQERKFIVEHIVPENTGSWKNNRLVFESADLGEICKALERRYGVTFVAALPALLQCKYSTTFDGITLQQSMDKLSLLSNVHFSRKGSIITIKGTPCTK